MVHVSTTAEVGEGSVRALRDVAVLDVLEEVKFEGLLTPALFGFGSRDRRHLKGVLALDGGAHALFKPGEILLCEWTGQAEIIVEASVDGRPDAEFRLGHELKHGLSEHVGGRMPHASQALSLWEHGEIDVGFERCGHGSPPLAASGFWPVARNYGSWLVTLGDSLHPAAQRRPAPVVRPSPPRLRTRYASETRMTAAG